MNEENCALKLVHEIILYYDARSEKHKKKKSLWYVVPNTLLVGDVMMEDRPATYWVQHNTSCSVHSNAPEDGRNCRPKHVELIWIYQ